MHADNTHSFHADYETDVLVVGYGGAGAVAAIAAHDAGAKVMIIEKMGAGGGATRLSSGGIFVPKSMDFADYLESIFMHSTPRDVVEAYVEHNITLVEYLKSIGVSVSFWQGNSQEVSVSYPPLGRPSWPKVAGGAGMVRVHATDPDERPVDPEVWAGMTNNERVWEVGRTYGVHLWNQLKASTEARGIDIQYNVRAKDLIQTDTGEVLGVAAEQDGKKVVYKAKKAVIMCTGGFASNEQMKANCLMARPFHYLGTNDFATGDGQIICQKAGARMWHMNAVCGQIAYKAPDVDQAFQVRAVDEAFVWVDKLGRRYQDETTVVLHNAWRQAALFDPDNTLEDGKEFPRIPTYMIFDESMRKKAPISRDWRPNGDHDWSLDNSEEIRRGWIIRADTLEELALKIDMEPAVLGETIKTFNAACETGGDEFGRDPRTMKPINHSPYYAMAWEPCIISTGGGPEHDKYSRVLDYNGAPIPRLYAVGELSTAMGWLYEAGLGHSEQVIFGKIAGECAAKEAPWASTE